jgi:hypothetical protein
LFRIFRVPSRRIGNPSGRRTFEKAAEAYHDTMT